MAVGYPTATNDKFIREESSLSNIHKWRRRAIFVGTWVLWTLGVATCASAQGFVFLGDSITQFLQNSPQLAGYPILWAGVTGDTTQGMYDRYQTLVQAANCVHVIGGTNDMAPQLGNGVKNYIPAIISTALAHGKCVYLGTVPPWGRGWISDNPVHNPASGSRASMVVNYNQWLKTLAQPGVTVIDYFSVLVGSDGLHYKAELTDDGVHPNAAGCAAMA